MPSVAFATYRNEPRITADDAPTADALRRAGVTVMPVVWDGSDPDWSRFDAVVLRSVWDYFRKADRFVQWVHGFTAGRTRLWNPPESVLWNINKRYLLDLAARGITIVPTEYLTSPGNTDLMAVLQRRGWVEAVVKPAIAAGSHGAWRTSMSAAEIDQPRLAEQLDTGNALVQSYMPEIRSKGEWSLIFFGLEYSHAVLKQPQRGDFRVQEHLGGQTIRAEPGLDLIDQVAGRGRRGGPAASLRASGWRRARWSTRSDGAGDHRAFAFPRSRAGGGWSIRRSDSANLAAPNRSPGFLAAVRPMTLRTVCHCSFATNTLETTRQIRKRSIAPWGSGDSCGRMRHNGFSGLGLTSAFPRLLSRHPVAKTTGVRLSTTATHALSVTPSCEKKQAPTARLGRTKKEECRSCISSRFSTNDAGAPPT